MKLGHFVSFNVWLKTDDKTLLSGGAPKRMKLLFEGQIASSL